MGMYNGSNYNDPKDELKARAEHAEQAGDSYVAVPINLVYESVVPRPTCDAKTTINGDRMSKTLIEITCKRTVDQKTGRHQGYHTNGKINW